MANVWPTADSFPQKPLIRGFNEGIGNTVIETTMDAGPVKKRQRYTAAYDPHSYLFHMTTTNVAALDTFYNTTCSGGAEVFEWAHPRTGSTVNWRFTSPPSWILIRAGLWEVSVELEQVP